MTELTLDGKTYVSSKRAAEITGYAKDYIGQLCREGRIEARQVGRAWYVLESALRKHRFGKEKEAVAEEKAAEVEPKKAPEPASKVVSTWEAPRYVPEKPEYIPEVNRAQVHASINLLNSSINALTVPDERDAPLRDLQSSWKEWFAVKQAPQLEPEHLLADHEEAVAPRPQEPLATVYTPQTTYKTQSQEPTADTDTAVAIHIERIATPKPALRVQVVPQEEAYEDEEDSEVMEMERAVLKGQTSTIATVVLVAVALVVIVIGVIGSGLADSLLNTYTHSSYISRIQGVTQAK